MILHNLIIRYLRYGDDCGFYGIQAFDTIRWLKSEGIELSESTTVLDLGCGHGIIGAELARLGCRVTFGDESNSLMAELADAEFKRIDIDKDELASLGSYDLVVCSNVLEHIPRPERLIASMDTLLNPAGRIYLSWTNWYSPWGGQDFSPFHYLGSRRGHLVFDKVIGRERVHTPYETLFPTTIGGTLRAVSRNENLKILKVVPRYYPEFAFVTRVPIVREFLTWNCVILAEKKGTGT